MARIVPPKRLSQSEEPTREIPPKPPKPKPAGDTRKSTPVQLEKELRNLFEILAGGIMFADPAAGQWTEAKAPELAKAWAVWANKNAAVRRALEALVAGGAAGNAIGVTAIWAMGLYLIYLSKRETLPPAWAMAGGLFGVPISDNGAASSREGGGAGSPPSQPGPGKAWGPPPPVPRPEDVSGGHIVP